MKLPHIKDVPYITQQEIQDELMEVFSLSKPLKPIQLRLLFMVHSLSNIPLPRYKQKEHPEVADRLFCNMRNNVITSRLSLTDEKNIGTRLSELAKLNIITRVRISSGYWKCLTPEAIACLEKPFLKKKDVTVNNSGNNSKTVIVINRPSDKLINQRTDQLVNRPSNRPSNRLTNKEIKEKRNKENKEEANTMRYSSSFFSFFKLHFGREFSKAKRSKLVSKMKDAKVTEQLLEHIKDIIKKDSYLITIKQEGNKLENTIIKQFDTTVENAVKNVRIILDKEKARSEKQARYIQDVRMHYKRYEEYYNEIGLKIECSLQAFETAVTMLQSSKYKLSSNTLYSINKVTAKYIANIVGIIKYRSHAYKSKTSAQKQVAHNKFVTDAMLRYTEHEKENRSAMPEELKQVLYGKPKLSEQDKQRLKVEKLTADRKKGIYTEHEYMQAMYKLTTQGNISA